MQGNFWVDENFPDVLHLGVHAPIFGGDVTGQARVELTSSLRYDIDLSTRILICSSSAPIISDHALSSMAIWRAD